MDDPLLRPSSSSGERGGRPLPSVSLNWRRAWRTIFKARERGGKRGGTPCVHGAWRIVGETGLHVGMEGHKVLVLVGIHMRA